MSILRPDRRLKLSLPATGVYATLSSVSFSAASSAPTPLYRIYQDTLGLTPAMVTLIFAIYVLGMLGAFLTFGRLSDHVGRRPMILAALLINIIALAIFVLAAHAIDLVIARLLQGIATGVALTTLGATIVDAQPRHGATLNGVTAFIGLTVGSLLSGALIAWAPLPTQLVYEVLLAVTAAEIIFLAVVPETTQGKAGAWGALTPKIAVPTAARPVMTGLLPLNLAGWALGGYYLFLMPSLVSSATSTRSPFLGASVVAALMVSATITVLALRARPTDRLLRLAGAMLAAGIALTLLAVSDHSAAGMIFGTFVAGVGFGSCYFGSLRALIPLAGERERAGLLAAYLVVSYTAFAVPAVVAGLLTPRFGLVTTSYVYGAALIVAALASFVITALPRRTSPVRADVSEAGKGSPSQCAGSG